MSEEMKRIDRENESERQRDLARSNNLTGEQLYVRSCNECHPGGKLGMGPTLENINDAFADDGKLKAFIRKGKGLMPAQPKDVIADNELDDLVIYVRKLADQNKQSAIEDAARAEAAKAAAAKEAANPTKPKPHRRRRR